VSAPIGPGDWVECVCNRLPTTLPPRGLVVGRVYQVEACGVTPASDSEPNVAWVRLVSPVCDPRKWGYRAEWFRPVYIQDERLIEGLKVPSDMALAGDTGGRG
jgi:hypothetical protein